MRNGLRYSAYGGDGAYTFCKGFLGREDPSCHITRCIDPRDICLLGGLNPEEAIL